MAQEICNNGKDDNGDGLIDLHDPDCQCHYQVTGNLLQNASFESYKNCPTNYSYDNDYKIIDYWQYGTYTNIDEANYYHNLHCSYDSSIVMLYMPPALPLPDGTAFVSVRQDVYRKPNLQETDIAKAYVGQCLQAPLQPGTPYTLSFNAGRFQSNDDTSFKFKNVPFTVALFGHADCNAVPFGKPRVNSNGCPANYPGWIFLGKTTLYSKGRWVQGKINFSVPTPINVVEIGPDCSIVQPGIDLTDSTTFLDFYVYDLDDLHLLPTKDFHFTYIQGQSRDVCTIDSVLQAPVIANATYQWYKDSVAIIGATATTYHIPDTDERGNYNIRVITGNTCIISEPYSTAPNPLARLHLPADTAFCKGDTFQIAPSLSGVSYSWNGTTDSIVKVAQSGVYNIIAADINGCRKTYSVNVHIQDCENCTLYTPNAFTPNDDGINDVFKVKPTCLLTSFEMEIFNRWGQKVFQSNNMNKGWDGTYLGKRMPSGSYVYFIRYKTFTNTYKTAKGVVVLIQ